MYLLDTNIVSELRKVQIGKGSESVARWSASKKVEDLYVSVITTAPPSAHEFSHRALARFR